MSLINISERAHFCSFIFFRYYTETYSNMMTIIWWLFRMFSYDQKLSNILMNIIYGWCFAVPFSLFCGVSLIQNQITAWAHCLKTSKWKCTKLNGMMRCTSACGSRKEIQHRDSERHSGKKAKQVLPQSNQGSKWKTEETRELNRTQTNNASEIN